MKKATISLLFLLACFVWTVRAEEILYVHNSESGEITMISIPGHEIIGRIQIGQWMDYLAASPDGKRLYVGSMMYHYLAIIDTEKLEMIDRIPFADGVRPYVFTKDEKLLYVQLSRLHGFVVVDFPAKKQIKTVELPKLPPEVKIPQMYPHNVNHGIALTPDEKLLFANGSIMNYVGVYTHPELKLIKTIPVGKDPNYVIFSKDGRYAYVTNRQSNDLSIIDVGKLEEVKRINLGRYPQRMVVVNVPERRSQ